MEKIKNLAKKIFVMPPIPTLLISIPSFALVFYVLAKGGVAPALEHISYILSAYAMILTVTGAAGIVKWVRNGIKSHPLIRKMLGIPLVERYVSETDFRVEVSLYPSLVINLLYAGIKLFSGILYHSVWFGTLAAYYILLAVMRASLLHYVRKGREDKASEWRRYRLCGIILLLMNVVLAGMVVLVVYENSGFEYPGMLIYVMAMYAFYAAITAVWNVVKFKRFGSPVMSAAKAISLTAALVSMLSLETAMLTQFGAADDPKFRQVMTASTGAGISILVVGMAVFMIWRSAKQLKAIEQEEM